MENIKIFDPSWVLDSIYNGIISINEEGVITYFNKTAERIFDIPADEVTNRFIQEVLPNISGRLMESLKPPREKWENLWSCRGFSGYLRD
jgi:sensor histidine kinase regulating citrate/malate metabolism